MVNSRNPLVSATHTRSESKSRHGHGHTFSRSYGVNLPSSLASVLSRALGFSPRPPESVCGTVTDSSHYAAFLGSMESPSYGAGAPPHHVSELLSRLWLSPPTRTSYLLEPALPYAGSAYPSPSLLSSTNYQWCRNINLLPITYPFRARLRGRLTHRRIILAWETLGLRREGFSPSLSLLMPT